MDAGRRDRRIILQVCTETQDSEGFPVKSWATLATVWAAVKFVRGDEKFLNSEKYAEVEVLFTITWRSDVTPKNRISHDGRTWEIMGVVPVEFQGKRKAELEIRAKARAE